MDRQSIRIPKIFHHSLRKEIGRKQYIYIYVKAKRWQFRCGEGKNRKETQYFWFEEDRLKSPAEYQERQRDDRENVPFFILYPLWVTV